jgi:hypothetical protein
MSKVSRGVYQKLSEENKRLKADLRTIVMAKKPFTPHEIETLTKYRKQFQENDAFNEIMKGFASDYIRQHPEEFKFLNGEIRESCTNCPHCKSDNISSLTPMDNICDDCGKSWTI